MKYFIKDCLKLYLGDGCVGLYGMVLDAEGGISTQEGKFIRWGIRDSKPHEPWAFSITIALSLAPVVKRPAEEISEELILYLRAKISGPWVFSGTKGYINVSFEPGCLGDYLEGKEDFDWNALKRLREGNYVHYRLQVLRRALEVRGIGRVADDLWARPLNQHPFGALFDYPEKSPERGVEWVIAWEKWLAEAAGMTRVGHLRNLSPSVEEILLSFIKACLN